MVASELAAPARLAPADAAGGLALSRAAGWNQTLDDWRFFLAQGEVFGVRDEAGTLIATAAALPYAASTSMADAAAPQGWVSMVLVRHDFQKRGLATRLMQNAIAALRARGVLPVLDATPAGAPVYRRLGFTDGFTLARWEGDTARLPLQVAARVREAGAHDIEAICALDARASGLDRAALLRDLLARAGTQALVLRDGGGFVIARAGVRATQIGPLVAGHEEDAQALLEAALERVRGRVFLDLPDRWTALATWLQARGFARQRPFVRMALSAAGQAPAAPPHAQCGALQFVLAGPEFG